LEGIEKIETRAKLVQVGLLDRPERPGWSRTLPFRSNHEKLEKEPVRGFKWESVVRDKMKI